MPVRCLDTDAWLDPTAGFTLPFTLPLAWRAGIPVQQIIAYQEMTAFVTLRTDLTREEVPRDVSIAVYQKNDLTLDITVQDETGAALNLAGAAVTFAVYPLMARGTALFTKTIGSGITIRYGTPGAISVVLTNMDTNIEPDTYRYELLVTDAAGRRHVAAQGPFIVRKSLIV